MTTTIPATTDGDPAEAKGAVAIPGIPQGYEVSTDPSRLDADHIHHWLSTDAYWAIGRSREKQDQAIANSLNFGLYREGSDMQVGYARVVTDHATFAWLCDVYIAREVRGNGLGTALVTAVRDHLAPHGLRRILLATHDAHGVYQKIGFAVPDDPENWMQLRFPPGGGTGGAGRSGPR